MAEAVAATGAPEEPEAIPFRFTATGGELFRIWIANLFLTIVTLGIYSPWAKVRTNRYLWSSTRLGDASFAYLASPTAILKGRLLVVGFFAVYGLSSVYVPETEAVFGAILLVLVPWAVVRSLAFRARNTAWRNIRFDFRGSYGEAFAAYLARPLLIPLTLGIAYPWVMKRQKQFLVEGSAFGTTPFGFGATTGAFFRIYAAALGLLVLGAGLLAGAAFASEVALVGAGVLVAPIYFYLFAFVTAHTANLVYGTATLGDHRLRSTLEPARVFGLYLTNALGILATLGLFIPWARVRLARYRLEQLALEPGGDLDSFVAAEREEVESVGAEMGDMLDIDIGL